MHRRWVGGGFLDAGLALLVAAAGTAGGDDDHASALAAVRRVRHCGGFFWGDFGVCEGLRGFRSCWFRQAEVDGI